LYPDADFLVAVISLFGFLNRWNETAITPYLTPAGRVDAFGVSCAERIAGLSGVEEPDA
jgi:hypothetical protein